MGMFRSVQFDLSCQRCARSYEGDDQFKTEDDWCQVYAVGDRVEDLPVGQEWEGIADRFCASCRRDHQAERERAMATVLAGRVTAGQLALKLPEAGVPLTPDEILVRGEEMAEAARRSSTLYGSTMVLHDLHVVDPDGAWLPIAKLRDPLWPSLYRALHAELRRRGWPAGDELFREDLTVFLDQERRVQVHVTEG
jgi:hypothetical protein